MSKNNKKIGIIAEDESDVDALKEIIKRITNKNNISFKYFVGRGCGKLKRKADDWAKQLKLRGCSVLILVHDLDRNRYDDLYNLIHKSLSPFAISKTLINIPVEEMESWFLADEIGLQKALKLKKTPKKYNSPETVTSPKEVLGREIGKASKDTKIYINTKHNILIAKTVTLEIVKSKCKSFNDLYEFIISSKI